MGAQSILYLRLDTYAQFVYLLSFDISRGGGGGGEAGVVEEEGVILYSHRILILTRFFIMLT